MLDLEEVAIHLDAATVQDNADCQEEEMELHPDYTHIDTEDIECIEEKERKLSSIYRKIDIPDMKELKENTATMDPFQREVINIGVQYAKEIKMAEKEDNQYPNPPNLMVQKAKPL